MSTKTAGTCLHAQTHEGPLMPLRYGSAKTVVCNVCKAYKLVTWLGADLSEWRTSDVRADVAQRERDSEEL